jgi:arylsulfatase A-like enzyme
MPGKPFFLYLAFNAPHGASTFGEGTATGEKKIAEGVQAPEKYVAMYRGKVEDEKLARYCGAVTCMDEAIGALMEAVEKAGQKDNTIFLFMSDNGGSGNGGNAPLKGSKGSMWEGGLRVPFIARWPGKLPAGQSDGRISDLPGTGADPAGRHRCPSSRGGEAGWLRHAAGPARRGEITA